MEQRYGACVQRVDGNGLGAIDCPLGVPRGLVGGRALVPIWDPSKSVFGVVKGDGAAAGLFGIKGLIFVLW